MYLYFNLTILFRKLFQADQAFFHGRTELPVEHDAAEFFPGVPFQPQIKIPLNRQYPLSWFIYGNSTCKIFATRLPATYYKRIAAFGNTDIEPAGFLRIRIPAGPLFTLLD